MWTLRTTAVTLTVVRPGAELEVTRLFVEGEVAHVELAGALVDGGRDPADEARVVDGHQLIVLLHLFVGTASEHGDCQTNRSVGWVRCNGYKLAPLITFCSREDLSARI